MNDDDECKHGLSAGTCGTCANPPAARRSNRTPDGAIWEKYRERYAQRPETFDAYVDVWKRSSVARDFAGGWTAFSRAANAEPAMDPALVSHAEDLMRQFGYQTEPKRTGVGRHWWKAVG